MVMAIQGFAQKNADIGILTGVATYMGDINNTNPMYNPGFAAGGFYRHNFHKFFSVRGSICYGRLSGRDADSKYQYQISRGASFKKHLIDFTGQAELNFNPWTASEKKKYPYTTYLFGGISYGGLIRTFGIPVGFGAKVNVYRKWSVGVEWGFRKTFNDNIDFEDQYTSGRNQYTYLGNKDWYTLCLFFISYKFDPCMDCPAFD